MLLPALNSAREKGRSIVCTNNLKQIGQVQFFYADEYDGGGIPTVYWNRGSSTPDWIVMIQAFYNLQQKVVLCPSQNQAAVTVLTTAVDGKNYLSHLQNYVANNNGLGLINSGKRYCPNMGVSSAEHDKYILWLGKGVRRASEKILISDTDSTAAGFDLGNTADRMATVRHNRRTLRICLWAHIELFERHVYNDAHYGTRNDDASTPPNFYGENVSSWLTYTNGNWINMKKLRQSSKWLLVADTWSGNAKSQKYSLYLGRAVASNNYLHLAHAGAANVLWGDLHVASMFRGEEVGKENGVLYCNDPRLGNGITF